MACHARHPGVCPAPRALWVSARFRASNLSLGGSSGQPAGSRRRFRCCWNEDRLRLLLRALGRSTPRRVDRSDRFQCHRDRQDARRERDGADQRRSLPFAKRTPDRPRLAERQRGPHEVEHAGDPQADVCDRAWRAPGGDRCTRQRHRAAPSRVLPAQRRPGRWPGATGSSATRANARVAVTPS